MIWNFSFNPDRFQNLAFRRLHNGNVSVADSPPHRCSRNIGRGRVIDGLIGEGRRSKVGEGTLS